MSENNETKLSSISQAGSVAEIGEFWDTHSLDDYWEQTQEAEFEVRAQRRYRIMLDPQLPAASRCEPFAPSASL
ncbi:MAG: hypothetical protein HOP19_29215 [Acidobacteria bacterium]|nr:hypothetical protein [Acidobacteriota bacterium]